MNLAGGKILSSASSKLVDVIRILPRMFRTIKYKVAPKKSASGDSNFRRLADNAPNQTKIVHEGSKKLGNFSYVLGH